MISLLQLEFILFHEWWFISIQTWSVTQIDILYWQPLTGGIYRMLFLMSNVLVSCGSMPQQVIPNDQCCEMFEPKIAFKAAKTHNFHLKPVWFHIRWYDNPLSRFNYFPQISQHWSTNSSHCLRVIVSYVIPWWCWIECYVHIYTAYNWGIYVQKNFILLL